MGMYICDGSQKGSVIGAGVFCIVDGEEFSYHFSEEKENASSEDAESYSIIKALEIAESLHDKNIALFNDSRRYLKKIKLGHSHVKHVTDKIDALTKQGFSVRLYPTNKGKQSDMTAYIKKAHQLSRHYLNTIKNRNLTR